MTFRKQQSTSNNNSAIDNVDNNAKNSVNDNANHKSNVINKNVANKGVVGNCSHSSKNVKNNNRDDGNVNDNKVKLEQRLKKSDIFSRED